MGECEDCGADATHNICGHLLCDECEEFERTFDIDAFEEEKRRRIAEENEY